MAETSSSTVHQSVHQSAPEDLISFLKAIHDGHYRRGHEQSKSAGKT
ncbi:MAG: hypothetical protein QUV07_01965 [Cyanobium sp. CZS 25K]|nr:hypothetical protein [Cyanobium sp. CZS25K]